MSDELKSPEDIDLQTGPIAESDEQAGVEEQLVEADLDGSDDYEEDGGYEEDEYEEVSSDEVDRVVMALIELIESVESENIKTYLEEASNNVFYLLYEFENDDEEEESGEAQAEAA